MLLIVEVMKSACTWGRGMVGRPAMNRTDRTVILHGGHVVVDLVGYDLVFLRRARRCTSAKAAAPCVDHCISSARIHCTRTGLPRGLRQNHRLVFRAGVSAVGPSVMAWAGVGMHDHVVGCSSKHQRDFSAKLLWILVVRVDVHRAIGFDVSNSHSRADRRVLHVGHLIGGGMLLACRRERRRHITFVYASVCDRSASPIGFLPKVFVELFRAG